MKQANWANVLTEPPFVPPPHSHDADGDKNADYRKWNYWMMSTRFVTISYATFGAGLSLVLYALFVVMADLSGLTIGVFRTLGSNALFAYVLHDIVGDSVKKFVPPGCAGGRMWGRSPYSSSSAGCSSAAWRRGIFTSSCEPPIRKTTPSNVPSAQEGGHRRRVPSMRKPASRPGARRVWDFPTIHSASAEELIATREAAQTTVALVSTNEPLSS